MNKPTDLERVTNGVVPEQSHGQRFVMGRSDYDEMSMVAKNGSTVPATQITPELYQYLRNVLPPQSAPGMRGEYMVEALNHIGLPNQREGTVTVQFCGRDGKYYAKYIVVEAPETWITDWSMDNALAIDPKDAEGFAF